MPSAGHIVHMPSHIYLRVGRYRDATDVNLRAIEADEDYLAQCQAQGLYPVGYYPHNIHMLWQAAAEEGNSAMSIDAARKVAAKIPHHQAGDIVVLQRFVATPLFALVRFGRWEEVLTEPAIAAELEFPNAIRHYARGVAFAARAQPERGEEELEQLNAILTKMPADSSRPPGSEPLTSIAQVAAKVLAGEIAARRKNYDLAIRELEEAVRLHDDLPYTEPPFWPNPTRQVLGAVLLEAGKPAEAEAVYRKDLEWNRDNGWTLYGLLQSLRIQAKTREAAEVEARFRKAWVRADVTLTASRF
jgi:tetratricopeptide (TPR) repeat protein